MLIKRIKPLAILVGLLLTGSLRGVGQTYPELNAQVSKLTSEGNNQAALPLAIRIKDSARRIYGDSADEYAGILYNLATIYNNLSNYMAAEPLYVQTCAIEKRLLGEEDTSYATLLNSLGLNYAEMGNFQKAAPPWQKALDIRKAKLPHTHPDYITSLENMASLYLNMGKFDIAEPMLKEAIDLRKRFTGEQSSEYANILNTLGILYFYKSNYAAAEPLYKQSAAIMKNLHGEVSYEYSTSLNNLGDLYNSMGYYSAALETQKRCLEVRGKLNGEDNALYAQSLTQVALVYFNMGNYAAAEPLYLRALPLRKKWTGEGIDYTYTLNNLATLYLKKGDYAHAEPLFRQSLEIRKKEQGEHNINYGWGLNNLAFLYELMGDNAKALPLLKQSVTIFREAGGEKSADYAMAIDGLSQYYLQLRQFDSAVLLVKQVLDIRKAVLGEKSNLYSQSVNSLAALYNDMGRTKEAKSLYEYSMTLTEKAIGKENLDYATVLNNIAQTHYFLGNYAIADSLYREALALLKRTIGENNPTYAHDLNNLAALYVKTGNYARAEKAIIECGRILLDHFHKNFLELSEGEKLTWWSNETYYFELAPSLLAIHPAATPEFLRQACLQQLQLKGFILQDGTAVLTKARSSADPQVREMLDQWQGNKATLARQYALPAAKRMAQTDSLEQATNELEKQINSRSAVFRQGVQNQYIGFEQVRQRLRPGEAAVEFVRFNSRYFATKDSVSYGAFIILSGEKSPHYVSLCHEQRLAQLLDSRNRSSIQFVDRLYRGTHVTNNVAGEGRNGDTLYKLVWKPLLPWLKGIKRIDIAPAGLLDRIAFNALPAGKGIVLIDRYQLRSYTSVRQLAEERIAASTGSPLDTAAQAVLYGGIRFESAENDAAARSGSEGWAPLPGTRQEVDNIGGLFRENRIPVRVISGEEATEESFKALSGHSPVVLHLATHGFSLPDAGKRDPDAGTGTSGNSFVMADNPLLRSGFIMAGANRVWEGGAPQPGKEDGIVTAYEIASLDLSHTDLVVLSACETALGDIRGTEGVFGLQRAFKLAGVKNMLLSLWQVPDEETAELMKMMYADKLKGMSSYEAFYAAQSAMRKKYPPYYWAAFVLME